jgi:hypothetical protein
MNTFAMRFSHEWRPQKDSATLRVMTWNVQGFANYLRRKKSRAAYRTNKAEMLATIDELHPDVLCMQEYRNIENAKRRTPIRKELDSLGFKYFYTSKDRAGSLLKIRTFGLRKEWLYIAAIQLLTAAKPVLMLPMKATRRTDICRHSFQ